MLSPEQLDPPVETNWAPPETCFRQCIRKELIATASSDPGLAAAGAPAAAFGIGTLLTDAETKPSPQLAFNNVVAQGYTVMTVNGTEVNATMHIIDETHALTDLSNDTEFASQWTTARFRVDKGAADLYFDDQGSWKKWDIGQAAWID